MVTAVRIMEAHLRRLILFGLVGISGIAVNTALLWALVSHLGMPHMLAAAIGSEISILSNFALNDRFTFGGHRASLPYVARAARYNTVCLGGTVISVGILGILTAGFGMYYLEANLAGIAVATMSNYVLNSRFTWSLHRNPRPAQLAEVPA